MRFMKKVLDAFLRFMHQKRSCFLWSSAVFWKFSKCKVHRKNFGRNFTIYVSKNEAVSREIQTHVRSFRPANFAEKVLGAIFDLWVQKQSCFPLKFRSILEVFGPQVLQKKVWVQFHDLCVQKRSCLPWSSEGFSKFSACKVQRISSGRIFTIYVSNNEAVCCVVQTHFGRFLLVRLTKKFWAHFHDLCVGQTNVLDLNIL